jgi:hypothetical protein
MNTLAPLFIVLAMLIATVVLLKIGKIRHSHIVWEGYVGLMRLTNGKAGSPEHKPEDGAS